MTAIPIAEPVADAEAPAERVSFEWGGRGFEVTYPAGDLMRQSARAILEGRTYPVLHLPDGPPSVILDVGASVGVTAVFFRAAYPGARILCYEPSPENCIWLQANTRGLEQVEVYPYGLLDQDAEWPLYEGESAGTQRSVIPNRGTSGRFEVVGLRGAASEAAARGLTEVSLLKLDTGGCELPILRSLLPALPRLDAVCVAYHSEEDRRMIDGLMTERFLLAHAQADQLHHGRVTYLARDVAARHPALGASRIAPLGATGAQPDPMEAVTFRFETSQGPTSVELLLGRRGRRQRIMLASLEVGQFHEPEVSALLTSVLQPGDVMVDAGAQVGYFSLLAARCVGPAGRVYAFEPEPGSYRRLRDHLTLNGLRQVQSFNVALGSVAGEADLDLVPDQGTGDPLWDFAEPPPSTPAACPARVEVAVLDHVLAGLAPGHGPRLLRLDAGGREYDVLKGALRTIMAHSVPYIVCQVNRRALQRMGSSEPELRGFMRRIGYQVSLLRPDCSGLQPLADDAYLDADGVFHLLFHL